MINGKRYSWEDITIQLPHGPLLDVEGIEYSDKSETEAIYGKGSMPRGYGSGNYSAEGKLTLRREEYERILAHAQKNGGNIYKLAPLPIVVSYANEDEPLISDRLQSCKFTETSSGGKQGDKSINVDLSFLILGGIAWNGVSPE